MKAPCDATTGGGRDFCGPREEYAALYALARFSPAGRPEGEGGGGGERRRGLDTEKSTMEASQVGSSRTIDKEETMGFLHVPQSVSDSLESLIPIYNRIISSSLPLSLSLSFSVLSFLSFLSIAPYKGA